MFGTLAVSAATAELSFLQKHGQALMKVTFFE